MLCQNYEKGTGNFTISQVHLLIARLHDTLWIYQFSALFHIAAHCQASRFPPDKKPDGADGDYNPGAVHQLPPDLPDAQNVTRDLTAALPRVYGLH